MNLIPSPLPEETIEAYGYFLEYLKLGPGRTLKAAYARWKGVDPTLINQASNHWTNHFNRNRWKARAAEYDRRLAELASEHLSAEFGAAFAEYYETSHRAHKLVSEVAIKIANHLLGAVSVPVDKLDSRVLNVIGTASKSYAALVGGLKSQTESYGMLLGVERLAEKYNIEIDKTLAQLESAEDEQGD